MHKGKQRLGWVMYTHWRAWALALSTLLLPLYLSPSLPLNSGCNARHFSSNACAACLSKPRSFLLEGTWTLLLLLLPKTRWRRDATLATFRSALSHLLHLLYHTRMIYACACGRRQQQEQQQAMNSLGTLDKGSSVFKWDTTKASFKLELSSVCVCVCISIAWNAINPALITSWPPHELAWFMLRPKKCQLPQAQPSGTLPCWPPFRVSAGCSNLNSIAAEIDKLMCEGAERERQTETNVMTKRHSRIVGITFVLFRMFFLFFLSFFGYADPAGVGGTACCLVVLVVYKLKRPWPFGLSQHEEDRDWRQRNKNNKRRQKVNTQLLTSSFALSFCWVH